MADHFVHEDDDRHAVFFRQVDGTDGQPEAFRYGNRADDDDPVVAVGAPAAHHDLALGRGGRLARCRTHALHVDDDDGDFRRAGQAEHFLLQGEARAGSGRHGLLAAHGSTDGGTEAGQLVFGLHELAAHLGQTGRQLFRDFSRRGDGVTAVELYAGRNSTFHYCLVAL